MRISYHNTPWDICIVVVKMDLCIKNQIWEMRLQPRTPNPNSWLMSLVSNSQETCLVLHTLFLENCTFWIDISLYLSSKTCDLFLPAHRQLNFGYDIIVAKAKFRYLVSFSQRIHPPLFYPATVLSLNSKASTDNDCKRSVSCYKILPSPSKIPPLTDLSSILISCCAKLLDTSFSHITALAFKCCSLIVAIFL